ncbi:TPA: polysaccharide pyruvyl transferase family protein [Vibrio parahaemolyticus]|uniref:WffA n=1 Tax=Vibrio parahaemolyticus TaxID=670 RepID=A0A5Q5AXC7_VIBPH|nr:polysaccharide pyruvyl transferase family protein [Vibrio parahaemolyticus]MEA5375356.1 polysaccharide pyruvyl transferase family protein [Vibrio parahaemolyticus]QEQ70855.1 wffA [Vibrio parahaemolyticus]HCG8610054.1 polysaccharide pyruvyl transferase family protein [Vibrio parahaemolyticus]HCG9728060.1 polysaccharide pyruvyl transferase family protein [Vibrio parahaemolyticus]
MNKLKIGFLWHNVSSGNLGVGALSISNMILVERALQSLGLEGEFYTIGDGECSDTNNHAKVKSQIEHPFEHVEISVKQLLINPIKLVKFISFIKSLDLVLDIGAGDSFSDIYGPKRFVIQVFTKIVSAKFGKLSILSPQTIGPFDSSLAKIITKYIIRNTKFSFARDKISHELAIELGECELATDVAFSMPFEVKSKFKDEDGCVHVGINVSGLLLNGGYTRSNQFGLKHDYKEFIKELIENFSQEEGVKIHLVSHVIATVPSNEIEDDHLACQEIKKLYPQCILADKFTNPIDAKNYIGKLDYFTGGRMHATVAAFSTGVAVTPYAYSRKFKGLYNTIGYKRILEAKELSLEDSVNQVMSDFRDRDIMVNEIIESTVNITNLTNNYVNRLKEALRGSY